LKIKLLFLLLSFTCFHFVQAQITFQKTYGTPKNDYGGSVTHTFDGGYIISAIYDSNQTAVIKTDSIGDTTWIKLYPYLTPWTEWNNFITQLHDSNYVMVGGTEDSCIYIVKLNQSGDTLWMKKQHDSSHSCGYRQVAEDKEGNLVLVGEASVSPTICCSSIFTKMSSTGSQIWSTLVTCPYPNGCRLATVVIDPYNGNYLVTGDATTYGLPAPRLVELDTAGKKIWDQIYLSYSASIRAILPRPDSGFVCAGIGWYSDSLMLFKITKNGNLVKAMDIPETFSLGTNYISIDTATNGYFLAGQSDVSSSNDDFFLSKLDTNYNLLWTQTFGGSQRELFGFMKTTSDGGAVMVGSTNSFGAGEYDVYLVKTDDNGFLTGQNIISIAQNSISISPNPFSQTTIIKTEKNFSNAALILYNSLGQVVRTLNGITGKEFALNRGNLPPGIYLLRITQEGKVASSKLIIED
jgi:hypothetical protein